MGFRRGVGDGEGVICEGKNLGNCCDPVNRTATSIKIKRKTERAFII